MISKAERYRLLKEKQRLNRLIERHRKAWNIVNSILYENEESTDCGDYSAHRSHGNCGGRAFDRT